MSWQVDWMGEGLKLEGQRQRRAGTGSAVWSLLCFSCLVVRKTERQKVDC